MKRRRFLLCWTALQAGCSLIAFLTLLMAQHTNAAIVPPPWSDPEKNPCATMPGGWQLLYWPPLKKCFKIFTIGYPCPETMELSPTATTGKKNAHNAPAAECRCPPGTALSATTNKCYKIFERGPCPAGQYFHPQSEGISLARKRSGGNRWGVCKNPSPCPNDMIYWPKDGKCYTRYTKGPCTRGKLIVINEDGIGECKCEDADILSQYFYSNEETCHEHYTRGPCSTPGHLFLPGGLCDCHSNLPHYNDDYQMCFELNTPGPCPPGHIFTVPENVDTNAKSFFHTLRAQCQCKDGYVPWTDGHCYRLYTRGPCGPNEFLINATSCIRNFCGKGRLYFPDQKSCYRIGSQGPCDLNQVVVFDFTSRPSVDGISFNGVCGCSGIIKSLDQQCTDAEADTAGNTCESTPGMVELNGNCYKLYSRGPCGPGQWLQPLKKQIGETTALSGSRAKCVCRPGYTRAETFANETQMGLQQCNAPSVGLARWFLDIFG